jgi:hypothetical protein
LGAVVVAAPLLALRVGREPEPPSVALPVVDIARRRASAAARALFVCAVCAIVNPVASIPCSGHRRLPLNGTAADHRVAQPRPS